MGLTRMVECLWLIRCESMKSCRRTPQTQSAPWQFDILVISHFPDALQLPKPLRVLRDWSPSRHRRTDYSPKIPATKFQPQYLKVMLPTNNNLRSPNTACTSILLWQEQIRKLWIYQARSTSRPRVPQHNREPLPLEDFRIWPSHQCSTAHLAGQTVRSWIRDSKTEKMQ